MSGKRGVLAIVALWFVLALLGSLFGVFAREILHAPIPLGIAAVVPVLLFLGWRSGSAEFQRFVLSLDLRRITLLQTFRVTGVLFVILYLRGVLPGVFALPAGCGDMAIGLTLGVLSSLPLGLASGRVTSQLMAHFPLSLIPTFFVPLFLILHLIALMQVRPKTAARPAS